MIFFIHKIVNIVLVDMIFQLLVVFLIFQHTVVTTKYENEICFKTKLRSELTSSFQQMTNVVRSFFNVTLLPSLSKLENSRKHVKKAFYKFINEAFMNKDYNCT